MNTFKLRMQTALTLFWIARKLLLLAGKLVSIGDRIVSREALRLIGGVRHTGG